MNLEGQGSHYSTEYRRAQRLFQGRKCLLRSLSYYLFQNTAEALGPVTDTFQTPLGCSEPRNRCEFRSTECNFLSAKRTSFKSLCLLMVLADSPQTTSILLLSHINRYNKAAALEGLAGSRCRGETCAFGAATRYPG